MDGFPADYIGHIASGVLPGDHFAENQVIQLGQLKRIYFEANGTFNLIMEKEPGAGLCILPLTDASFRNELNFDKSQLVCGHCGHPHTAAYMQCSRCNQVDFVHPVTP